MNDNGITKERLLSYDRAIHSEPNFRRDQKEGLLRDLGNYMRTLKVVFIYAVLIMCFPISECTLVENYLGFYSILFVINSYCRANMVPLISWE